MIREDYRIPPAGPICKGQPKKNRRRTSCKGVLMRQVQIIPNNGFRLYGALVAKEVELAKKNRGTFHRSAAKQQNRAKWTHASYPGWIKIARGMGEVVMIEIHSKKDGTEWQLLQAILGFPDRYFSREMRTIHI